MWIIIVTALLAIFIYVKCVPILKYWDKKGIPFIKPWPIFGNLASNFFRLRALAHIHQNAYQTFPEERYVRIYNFTTPVLLLRDPDLVKQIMVKDFDTFPEHLPIVTEDSDPLWDKTLVEMSGGERWHQLRSTLSPSFTGSKMRIMFSLMQKSSEQFSQHFLKQGGLVTVELKDAFTRFTNDVIANTALGVTCDSLEHPKNDIYTMGKDLTDLSSLKFLIFLMSPVLTKLLKLRMINKKVNKFFTKLVKDTIKFREENNVYRPDMIHLLMQARIGQLNYDKNIEMLDTEFAIVQESELTKTKTTDQNIELTDFNITAQVLIFYFGGFDTASTLMCYASYELALNLEIQENLHKEIEETLRSGNGEFTYEGITKMKYLDMIVSESLRKWPPIVFTDRRSVHPYTIKAKTSNEKDLKLDAHTGCIIPIYAIQRDPKYYPDPDKFDPERFNDENKHLIRPFTYLPFGTGPRNCIGSRYAILIAKLALAEIVRKFETIPVTKTEIPLVISKYNFNPLPDNGFWLGLNPRS